LFKTRSEVIVIAAGNDRLFKRLCDALPLNPSFAERYADQEIRKDSEAAITLEIENVLAQRDASEWISILKSHGIPCAVVNDVAAAVSLPTVQNGDLLSRPEPESDFPYSLVSSPIRFPLDDQVRDPGQPPRLDEHREQILSTISAAQRP
jgi:CoA:oxalate CoA-transferase